MDEKKNGFDDRFVALCFKAEKDAYFKYCGEAGLNPSENIRVTLRGQVEAFKASKA